jgi:hypothetical protein
MYYLKVSANLIQFNISKSVLLFIIVLLTDDLACVLIVSCIVLYKLLLHIHQKPKDVNFT